MCCAFALRWNHDQVEVAVDGYVVDIVHDDATSSDASSSDELIEIQTHNFAALKPKLLRLAEQHRVRLVYPIAQARWIPRVKADRQTVLGRRKSPRHGTWDDIFVELVSLPELMAHPHFILEVVSIHEDEIRCPRASRSRRRESDWRVCNRRLLKVVESVVFATPAVEDVNNRLLFTIGCIRARSNS